jgi:hypothetical protein
LVGGLIADLSKLEHRMPYINPFRSIVTTTKKNNRYYGPTESQKMASFLTEVSADINTISDELNTVRNSYNALASGYLSPNDSSTYSTVTNEVHDGYTKLMLHGDSAPIFDSSSASKTITNTGIYSSNAMYKLGSGSLLIPGGNDTYTTLLLHGDSSPIADSEPTPKTVTNVGVTCSTSQLVFGNGSMYFNGSSYLTLADSADWYFSNGNFTIDFWVKFNTIDTVNEIDFCGQYADATHHWRIGLTASGRLVMLFQSTTQKGYYTTALNTITDTGWHHLSFERYNATAKIFLDGISLTLNENVAFASNDVGDIASVLTIGTWGGSSFFLNGYIDEFRISRGISRRVSSFTVPQVAYSTSCLSIADSSDWDFGIGDFTIDGWFYLARAVLGYYPYTICSHYKDANNYWYCGFDFSGAAAEILFSGKINTVNTGFKCSWTPTAETFYHVAFVRRGSNGYIFVNGASQAITGSALIGGDIKNMASPMIVGSLGVGTYLYEGYIDELRISKDIARWTSNFTVPSAPYGLIQTNLQLGMDNVRRNIYQLEQKVNHRIYVEGNQGQIF